jgi:hypothetical protein
MGQKTLLAALALLLGLSIAFMIYGWGLGGPDISPLGYGAMAWGILLTLIVGCGLMALVFLSHRQGYDEPPRIERDRRDSNL